MIALVDTLHPEWPCFTLIGPLNDDIKFIWNIGPFAPFGIFQLRKGTHFKLA